MANTLKVLKGSGECVMAFVHVGLGLTARAIVGPYKLLNKELLGMESILSNAKCFWDSGIEDIKEGIK